MNIALKVVCDGINDLYDRAVIVSADSDLIPVFTTIEQYAPSKEVGVMFPIGLNSVDLSEVAHFRLKMNKKRLQAWQFPADVIVGNTIVSRPQTWV